MNCPKCGNELPLNASACPLCGTAVNPFTIPSYFRKEHSAPETMRQPIGSYQSNGQADPAGQPIPEAFVPDGPEAAETGNAQPKPAEEQPQPPRSASQPIGAYARQAGMANNTYQTGSGQYGPGAYPPGYEPSKPPKTDGIREPSPVLTAMSTLPKLFLNALSAPSDTLRSLVETRDLLSCGLTAFIILLLTFLSGMVVLRSVLGGFIDLLSSVFYGSAAVTGGTALVSGQIVLRMGGTAVLCQIFHMIIPTAVFVAFICLFCKVMFSWELALGYLTVTALPTAASALLAMLFSLFSPVPAVLMVICGACVSYVQACGMLAAVTVQSDEVLLPYKMILTALSVLLTLLMDVLIGGSLFGGMIGGLGTLIRSL